MAMIIENELEPEIQEIIDILRSSDAVESTPKFGPTLYGSNDLYDLPVGYVVRIDFAKFARALWDYGYRLVNRYDNSPFYKDSLERSKKIIDEVLKGEDDGRTEHEN